MCSSDLGSLGNYTGLATKSDNCTATGSITVTQSPIAGTAVSGVGTTVVTLTATDASGNSSTCTFNVSRVDNTKPTISCPSAITLAVNSSCAATLPNFVSSLGNTVLANSSSDFSGVQGNKNWYYGEYPAFNSNAFTQLPTWTGFVWQDNQAFNTPFLDANGGHPGVTDFKWAVRRWISNYTGTVNLKLDFYDRNTSCGNGVNVRVRKNTTQIWEYLNLTSGTLISQNTSTTIAAGDILDFAIDPIGSDAGCDDTHFSVEITATNGASATDNCGTVTVTQSPAAGAALSGVGTTTVTLTATDASSNSSTCTFNVSVVDNTDRKSVV